MTGSRLLLVRHGVTDWNREGRFQGHLDPPLAHDGSVEARLLGERLAHDPEMRPRRVLSSSLGRAAQTAEAIGAAARVPVETDRRLIEIGQGEWEGRTHDDLARTDTERYEAWRSNTGIRQPPGGETIEAATARLDSLLEDLGTDLAASPTCLVSHGGTLRILARLLLGAGDRASWSLDVDNASLGVCTLTPAGWRLDRWNDTFHLLGRMPTHVDEAEGRPLAL